MEKVIRDNKVAVLVSPEHGAGWYSWNPEHEQLIFSPKVVQMVEDGRRDEITEEWVKDNLGIDIYAGGASNLEVMWLDKGTAFYIDEYDGFESILTIEDLAIIA